MQLPASPLRVECERLTDTSLLFTVPAISLTGAGETQEEAASALVEAARQFAADYLAGGETLFFADIGADALLPYVLAIKNADDNGMLGDYLLGGEC